MLPTLGKTFRPVRRKNSAAEKIIRSPTKFDFLMAFGRIKILFLWLRAWEKYNISLICTEFHRKNKRRKTIFSEVDPFCALSVQTRPKFVRSFVRPLYFLLGPFSVMRPNNRPVATLQLITSVSTGSIIATCQ